MVNISVIVPVYNVKHYLRECLNSLGVQRFSDCEFICIDDGSTDDSCKVIENCMNGDGRFRLIRQENKGLAETRNVGIRNAQGKYIAFLDADDYFLNENVLNTLFQKAEEDDLELLSFETELLYEGNVKETDNKDFYYYKNHAYQGIRKGKEFFIDMMSNHEYCDSACLLFINREWLLNQGILFYPGILYEDALFCMQCFLKAERMAHLSEKLYRYRVREKSIMTGSIRWENVRSRLVVYREILYLLILQGKDDPRLQKQITEYLSLLASHAKYMDEFRIDKQSNVPLTPLDNLLMKTMELGNYRIEVNESIILDGLEKLVADSEGIILYGAGDVGRMFYHFLEDKGLNEKVLCYAVSEVPDKTLIFQKVPVLPISEAIKKQGEIILSVIAYNAREGMKRTLRQLGVSDFQVFDQYIYRALRHYTQESGNVKYEKGKEKDE